MTITTVCRIGFENNDGNPLTGQFDHDNDGVADYLDADDDNDGILDEFESWLTLRVDLVSNVLCLVGCKIFFTKADARRWYRRVSNAVFSRRLVRLCSFERDTF